MKVMFFENEIHKRKFSSKNQETTEKIEKEKYGEKVAVYKKNNFEFFHLFTEMKLWDWNYLINILYKPTWPSSLGVVRALFGLMMAIDIPDERGLANIDLNFGDPMRCHFPLFNWLSPLSLEYMGLVYTIMWIGSLGICLGYKFKLSCLMFGLPYWYIYLLDKSFWNNHSYLYGLVSILFAFTCANYSFSVDALLNPAIRSKKVPMWNYAIIRFQFFLLYFYAGIKKFDPDWIGGYSMSNLSLHWVFEPFRLVLNNDQIDFWIIHIFGFIFDLTVGFFLLIDKTRVVAIIFASAFHLMNSCMFYIGQFPYVCLVTIPIFCEFTWPEQLMQFFGLRSQIKTEESIKKYGNEKEKKLQLNEKATWKKKLVSLTLSIYVIFQLFLPFSHFVTQGYNNWTNGLYGYSWDMMVQNWDSSLIVVKVIDNRSKKEFFIDPEAWVGNTRYSKHGDMLVQYAKCLKRNLNSPWIDNVTDIQVGSFKNISIHVDVWCSLNGRFLQRMFAPRQDLLTAEWNPFSKITWLMPLLSDLSSWRQKMQDIQKEVHNWSNISEVLFVVDFPGLYLENYIGFEFTNVTVTVLQGTVILEVPGDKYNSRPVNITLKKGEWSRINEGTFHKIYTISNEPSYYMYIYNNFTMNSHTSEPVKLSLSLLKEFFIENFKVRFKNLINSMIRLRDCFNKLLFNVPIPIRNVQVK